MTSEEREKEIDELIKNNSSGPFGMLVTEEAFLLRKYKIDKIQKMQEEIDELKLRMKELTKLFNENFQENKKDNTLIKDDKSIHLTNNDHDQETLSDLIDINDKKWKILMDVNGVEHSWKGIFQILPLLCGRQYRMMGPDNRFFPILKYFMETYSEYYATGVQYLTDNLIEYTKNFPEYQKYVCQYIKKHNMENQFTVQQNKEIYLNLLKKN